MNFWQICTWILGWPLWPLRARTKLLAWSGLALHPTSRIAAHVFIGGRSLSMGEHTLVNVGSFLDGSAPITIGDFTRLGPHVKVLTGSHHYAKSEIRRDCRDTSRDFALPVMIERGCWIGIGATIMPGVTIARGCIVAAGAVVTHNTLPNGLYAGVPAKRVRDLEIE